MGWVEGAGLYVLHAFYVLWQAIVALFSNVKTTTPQPLDATRKKLPKHLALLLADTEGGNLEEKENAVVQSICEAVRCCSKAGIHNLSVYDRSGISVKCAGNVRSRITETLRSLSTELDSSSESDLEYPLTPPASDSSNSRPSSPQESFNDVPFVKIMRLRGQRAKQLRKPKEQKPLVKRRHPTEKSTMTYDGDQTSSEVKLTIFSYDSSKPAIALVARNFARRYLGIGESWEEQMENPATFIDAIDSTLLDITRVSPPELMVVHSLMSNSLKCPALELEGFPPWIMRLTEIYHELGPALRRTQTDDSFSFSQPTVLTEETFCRAIDGFASAEMRMGK